MVGIAYKQIKMLDFTKNTLIALYENFLECGYKITTVSNYLKETNSNKICILRHDIDRNPEKALNLAYIEKKMNIAASYYFRYPKTYDKNVIKKIYYLGHEIGYHYEALTKAKGKHETAIKIFNKELEEFRKIVPIKTICAHGAPLSPWDEKKIWEKYNFQEIGISTETNLSFNFNEILYLTDTSRSWNRPLSNIKDRVETKLNYRFNKTADIISAIKKEQLPDKIMLNIHPQRWVDSLTEWSLELIAQNLKNVVKLLIVKTK